MRSYWVAIPTYWTHPGGEGPEAIVFDHPTPLDAPGTLRRTWRASFVSLPADGGGGGGRGRGAWVGGGGGGPGPGGDRIPGVAVPGEIVYGCAPGVLQDFCRSRGRAEWLPLMSLGGMPRSAILP